MKRPIFYPNEILTDTMLSNQARDDLKSIGRFMQSVMGSANAFDGLLCTASVSTMSVNVGTGVAYSLQNVDNTAYGSIGADLTHQTVKIGKLTDAVNLLCPAPTLAGKSINYLVQGAFVESDGGAQVLQFYNSSDPSQPYSGPLNDNASVNTVRDCLCSVSIKTGTPATTGSQTTPAPDAGYTGLYVVTVAYGATSVVTGNISTLQTAPFIPASGLMPTLVQTTRRGLDDYDPNTNNMIGDRIIGDNGKTFKSTADNNRGNMPSTSPAFWERWGFTLSELWTYLTTGLDGGVCPNTGPAASPTLANPYTQYTSALGEKWQWVGGDWKVTAGYYGVDFANALNPLTGGAIQNFSTKTMPRAGKINCSLAVMGQSLSNGHSILVDITYNAQKITGDAALNTSTGQQLWASCSQSMSVAQGDVLVFEIYSSATMSCPTRGAFIYLN